MADKVAGNALDDQPAQRPVNLREDFPPQTREQWREQVEKDLKGADYQKKLVWKTIEGIEIEPMYFRQDLPEDLKADAPGVAPFRRGTTSPGRRKRPWQIRQDSLLASPEDVNAALRDGLARGMTAIGIRLDNAARQGIDGDSPEAIGLAGRGGCTLSSINGLRIALAEIPLDSVPITIRTGTSALPLLAMLVSLADEQGVDRQLLTGAVEGDPLRELVKLGRSRGSLALRWRELSAMASFCARECPGIRPVMVNTHPVHNAGASAVQELGWAMAAGAEYMRALTERGLSADQAALAMSFSLSVSTNIFVEIAKLRAARVLWARATKAFGVEDTEAMKLFLHTRTSTRTKARFDPYNNMVRSILEGFAAASAGTETLYIAPFDESIGRADNFSSRIARNQHLLLQFESHVGDVADPAGGSYYVEHLTSSLAKAAWELFTEIEKAGGLVKALEEKLFQNKVHATAKERRKMVEQRRTPIVGVSNYADPQEKLVEKQHISREFFIAERVRRLNRLKSTRSGMAVRAELAKITQSVTDESEDLMAHAVSAVDRGATIGEIIGALLAGDQDNPTTVEPLERERAAEPFEMLRDFSLRWKERRGSLPKVLLVPTGPLAMRRARADFCHGFFGAAGFEIEEPKPFSKPEEAADFAAASSAFMTVVCSADETYPEFVPAYIKALKERSSNGLVYVAGYPQDSLDALKAAGTDGFIHVRSNAWETLKALQDHLGRP